MNNKAGAYWEGRHLACLKNIWAGWRLLGGQASCLPEEYMGWLEAYWEGRHLACLKKYMGGLEAPPSQ